MLKYLKKHKKYLFFVLFIIIIGFSCGLIYFLIQDNTIKNDIITSLNNSFSLKYNAILKDLISLSIILVLSFFVIGLPLGLFYLFYESLSVGFMLLSFLYAYSFKGFIFFLFYFLINKLLFFILLIFYLRKIINIARLTIGLIIYRQDNVTKEKLIQNFIKALFITIFILIIDIILYFVTPFIFTYFSFLIK